MRILIVIGVIIGLFVFLPMFIVIPISFSDSLTFKFPPTGFSLTFYERFFSDERWLLPTANSVVIAFLAMVLTLLIVVPAAFGLVRYRFTGRSAINLLMMTPLMVPHIVMALAYYRFLGPLHLLGTHFGVVLAHTCFNVPIAFLIVSAALKGFDRNLERAAMSAGAGPLRTFFYVTMPVLRPAFLISALFSFIHSFDEATVAIFISGRVAQTLPRKMFSSIRMEADPVIAAVSSLLFAVVLVAVLISLFWRQWQAQAGQIAD